MNDMRGHFTDDSPLHHCVPRNLKTLGRYEDAPISFTPTNPRRLQSPLIPASMPWSTELSSAPASDTIPSCRRRAAPDLMATTMQWTTPMNPSVVDSLKPPIHVRRQATDLIPQTMPWVTQVKKSSHNTVDVNQYRRRRVLIENEPVAKTSPLSTYPSVCRPFSFSSVSASIFAQSEPQLRALLSSQGVHAVSVKFDRDVITGDKKGGLQIVVRFPQDKADEVEARLRDLISSTTRGG